MKLYTKTGDNGETGYIGGRTSKGDLMMAAIGDLDELNCNLGVVSVLVNEDATVLCSQIQSDVFALGALVATVSGVKDRGEFWNARTSFLENRIDEIDIDLPKLQNFILPGGTLLGAELHRTRAVCRRAERGLVRYIASVSGDGTYIQNLKSAARYLNRLSDFVFVWARQVNFLAQRQEQVWQAVV